ARAARAVAAGGRPAEAGGLSLEEIRRRNERLSGQIRELETQPPRKTLRYHTPVSRPVQGDELMFECRGGRVTFIDIAALLAEVRQGLQEKGKQLRGQWQVADYAGPGGAYRLRYTVERQPGLLDTLGSGGPEADAGFRSGITSWQLEPVTPVRGETAEAALADGSEFRRVADLIDPRQTTVTFWVYPNSFALYRRLRDVLYDRDVVVAGRPLPDGF